MLNTFSDINHIRWQYETKLAKLWDELNPIMQKAYNIVNDGEYFFDIEKSRSENIRQMWSDDHSINVGVLKGCTRGKALYFAPDGSADFVVLFNDKEYTDNCGSTIGIGVRIFRVYDEIDMNCIENIWNLNNTTKWITNSDLVTDTFTDVTEHSQMIDDKPVCERPTTKRLLNDLNKDEFQHYGPIYCTSTRHHMADFSLIEYCFNNMMLLCVRLDLPGVKL